jgi:hypothetical protein
MLPGDGLLIGSAMVQHSELGARFFARSVQATLMGWSICQWLRSAKGRFAELEQT